MSVFLKKQKSKRKKSDCIYLGCTTLILKIASLSVEKKNKTLSSVNIKGGASLFSSVFLINYIITHSLREEHERRLSSHNEQQRKERAREEETTLFFCSFLQNFYLRSKLWEEERRLICFLKEVF